MCRWLILIFIFEIINVKPRRIWLNCGLVFTKITPGNYFILIPQLQIQISGKKLVGDVFFKPMNKISISQSRLVERANRP